MNATGTIGVLALQGGFQAHARVLSELGAGVREVRLPADLDGLCGLVLPGGESTTMMLGVEREHLAEPLARFVRAGEPVLATCAGAIILDDAHLGLLDVTCDRNAYGGQVHSFEADLTIGRPARDGEPFRGIFIRAPRFARVGGDVETLAEINGEAVALMAGPVIATSFHPELAADDRIHRLFLEKVSVNNVTEISRGKQKAA